MMNKTVAKKDDWKIFPMPKETVSFTLNKSFNEQEIANLRYGNIPQEMEDKWFYYMEGDLLYAYRSWTGICIYIVDFNFETNIHSVVVNRNQEQYSNTDIETDKELLNSLLDYWKMIDYDYYGEWLNETNMMIEKNNN